MRGVIDAVEILRRGVTAADGPVGLACSFSLEDAVIVDLLRSHELPARVFALDTGRLPEETHQAAESLRARYGIDIEWHFPDRIAVEALVRQKGSYSMREGLEERHACCDLRKVQPLRRALVGLSGWITGQRREHGLTRASLEPIEHDDGGRIKLNPLYAWSDAELWSYARARGVPQHPLYASGYTSIGCAPCTRATGQGEHPRAGRWWWELPEHKECGLHRREVGGRI